MTWVMWNLLSIRLDIVLVSVQDRCMVCAKRTIGLDIIFNAPMALLGDMVHVKSCFGLFGDSVGVGAI